MASEPPPPPRSGGLSLYANLLESSGDSSTAISRAPVVFKQPEDKSDANAAPKKTVDPALRFQPIRRPVVGQKKAAKPTMTFPKTVSTNTAVAPSTAPVQASKNDIPQTQAPQLAAEEHAPSAKPTLADFAATIDEDAMYYGTGEPKRKRKKKKKKDEPVETDWDELYDPARPTNVEEYLRSDERIREVREWKDKVLYRHKLQRQSSRDKNHDQRSYYSEDEENEYGARDSKPKNIAFAPPPSYGAVPPPPPDTTPTANVPDDATGDDAYARRLAMSTGIHLPTQSLVQPPPPLPSPPPPPSVDEQRHVISGAPVRYAQPEPTAMDEDDICSPSHAPQLVAQPGDDDHSLSTDTAPDAPKSNRPGQVGFAERLMSKYGWSKGSGLGVDGSGIINPLAVKVEKRSKSIKSDPMRRFGGGGSGSAKIVGGNVSQETRERQEAESLGKMSRVVVLQGMLDGMTEEELEAELREGELQQDIGGECGEKYGRVERLHVQMEGERQVWIKFTEAISALRAVNALQGRIFNGNPIKAKFFDEDKFEQRDLS